MHLTGHDMYAPFVHRGSDGLLRDGNGKDARLLSEFTRDELLWLFRTDIEGSHRSNTQTLRCPPLYQPSVRDAAANCLPDISEPHWMGICNKSVPVYILPGQRWLLLRSVLHNYIYRRWFRPYRSEIDFERFICQFIIPKDLADSTTVSLSTVQHITALNQAIIAKFEAQRISYLEKGGGRWCVPLNLDPYILQPLFRALVIIVSDEKYHKETSAMLGNLPVYLARTGIEEGLSAPISFEPIAAKISSYIKPEPGCVIQVTLETAIDFVIHLEAREAAAFGRRPDPATDWKPSEDMTEAWQSIGETEPLVGPNSQWVDDGKYPEWSGIGKINDVWHMAQLEEQAFWVESCRESRAERYKEAQRAADAARESAGSDG